MSHAPNTWLWCTVLVLWSKVHRPFSFIGCMFEWVTVWLGSTGLRYNRRWSMSFQSNVLSMFWRLWASCCYILMEISALTWTPDLRTIPPPSCRWQRSWGVTHRCCQLQSLSRLSQQNPEAVLNLRGIHTWKRVNKGLCLKSGLELFYSVDILKDVLTDREWWVN